MDPGNLNYLNFSLKISNLQFVNFNLMEISIFNLKLHHLHLKYPKYAFCIRLQSLQVIHFAD